MPDIQFASVPLEELNARGLVPDDGPLPPLVLVVDDEPLIADTLAIILRQEGFSATAEYDAKNALQVAMVTPPDLLLTDVVMPGMDGIELAVAVLEQAPDCRIVLLSGQAATVDLLAKKQAVTEDFTVLAKPIPPQDLLLEVSRRLGLANTPRSSRNV